MIETLYDNEWLSLKKVVDPENDINGYVYSHETKCQGQIVVVLPYRYKSLHPEFLVRSEVTPCWSLQPIKSAVTGGYEGEDIEEDAVREMLEETGYTITKAMLEPLGTCYASKSADTVYTLFAVDVTHLEPGLPTGDGSPLEGLATNEWMRLNKVAQLQDAQLLSAVLRFLY